LVFFLLSRLQGESLKSRLLRRHIATIVASPDYREVTERAGSIPAASSPVELRKIVLQTRADVEATIQEFGLQQEQ
jgi:tripartite-type tricarboxylate transporter receptor subunit TctC